MGAYRVIVTSYMQSVYLVSKRIDFKLLQLFFWKAIAYYGGCARSYEESLKESGAPHFRGIIPGLVLLGLYGLCHHKGHNLPSFKYEVSTILLHTSLPAAEIVQALVKKGYDVILSDDAGRFVCNYVYYHSLQYAGLRGFKSLFVHVPLFTKIDEETQMQFITSLLEILVFLSVMHIASPNVLSNVCVHNKVLHASITSSLEMLSHSKKM
eukprot:Gb_25627 [translate_table: standard]